MDLLSGRQPRIGAWPQRLPLAEAGSAPFAALTLDRGGSSTVAGLSLIGRRWVAFG